MRFFGRKEELAALHRVRAVCEKKAIARMIAVTGRRRVGKTTLITKAFDDGATPYCYVFVPPLAQEAALAQELVREVASIFALSYPPTIDKLADAIGFAMDMAHEKTLVIAIDECQELDQVAPGFWGELQGLWDQKKAGSRFLLVMSGSVQSAVERIFGDRNEPLYGRTDLVMFVRPFTCQEMQEIFRETCPDGTAADLLELFAYTGGVARYVELLSDYEVIHPNRMLDYIFSESGSWFRSEGRIFLANEMRVRAPINLQILQSIAASATTWAQIQATVNEPINAHMTRLEKLFRIIERSMPIFSHASQRQAHYGIADPYFRFWLEFISPEVKQGQIERRQWEKLIHDTQLALPTFLGTTLEVWHRQQISQTGQWDQVAGWWDRKGENEIDVVAVSEAEKRLFFGECKRNLRKYDPHKLTAKVGVFLNANPQFQGYQMELKGLGVEDCLS